eukprot:scaffold258642_cov36-Tisochrysis_lutea.AAC.1
MTASKKGYQPLLPPFPFPAPLVEVEAARAASPSPPSSFSPGTGIPREAGNWKLGGGGERGCGRLGR